LLSSEITVLKPAGTATDDAFTKVKAAVARILRYEENFDETYLTELLALLPSPDQVRLAFSSLPSRRVTDIESLYTSQEAQLNVYKSAPPEELDFLAPADRFLIEISKIYRLKPRLKAMIYRAKFIESIEQIEEEAQKVYEASKSLLHAPHFSELLKVSFDFSLIPREHSY